MTRTLHIRSSWIAGAIVAFGLILCMLPYVAAATSFEDFQSALSAAQANTSLSAQQRANINRIAASWSDTPTNRQAFANLDAAGQDALVSNLNSYTTGAASRTEAARALQKSGGSSCIPLISFDFYDCIANPVAIWSSSMMLSLGGAILRLSGAIFDFGVNHVIIDFKNTLDTQLHLMTIIKSGWTFFRDVANIFIIGIFVFIAISLILGLKEYGQKKLIARVLVIAVLMNFSLLFTTIIIDASNFLAYSIYSITEKNGNMSVADKVLAPLHVTGVWDTAALAQKVAKQGEDGGALKAFAFGLFGFLILAVLAVVIFYGAFLILARAILFIFLMLTAPIAYATYLAPNFEASQFGWSAWWKSLINNAAFAPLLMMFLSISILIMQTAAPSVNPQDTIGALLTSPETQVLADGWKVLFIYILGTGLLFASFRMSSSLAGSISGVRLGQMAAGVPLALGFAGAGKFAQYTAGRKLAGAADNKGAQMQAARLQALRSGKAEDWAKVEQLRKQKDMLEKGANSSFNLMNTRLGKALAGGAGLGALGQTKGGFTDAMHARAVAAEERAKQAQVTEKDKAAMRAEAEKATLETHKKDLETAEKNLEMAKTELDKARTEQAAANDSTLAAQAEAQTTKNKIDRAPEADQARREVHVVETRRTEMANGQKAEIETMMKEAEKMSGRAREEQIRAVEAKRAEHQTAIKQQDQKITDARNKVATIDLEITAPQRALADRQRKAAQAMNERETAFRDAETRITQLKNTKPEQLQRKAGDVAKEDIKTGQENAKRRTHEIAEETAGPLGGAPGAHVVQHHFEEKFKKKSGAESIADVLKGLKDKGSDSTAH